MESSSKSKKRRVRFEVKADPGSKVFLAGSFNGWNPAKKQLVEKGSTGSFSGVVQLDPGRYEYKFVINDVWCVDPACQEWVPNEHGSLNSVIDVK